MSGKCRPHLTAKTLENVKRSNLMQADKNCIQAVFERFENQKAEIESWQGGYMTQKQEIANLETELKAMRGAANGFKAEVERLQSVADSFTDIGKLYSEIKAEAYKEFADKVENEIDCQPCSKGMQESAERYRIKRIINNTLKELVGDADDKH